MAESCGDPAGTTRAWARAPSDLPADAHARRTECGARRVSGRHLAQLQCPQGRRRPCRAWRDSAVPGKTRQGRGNPRSNLARMSDSQWGTGRSSSAPGSLAAVAASSASSSCTRNPRGAATSGRDEFRPRSPRFTAAPRRVAGTGHRGGSAPPTASSPCAGTSRHACGVENSTDAKSSQGAARPEWGAMLWRLCAFCAAALAKEEN